MDPRHDIIGRYIERVEHLRHRGRPPSEAELHEIAVDLGLSPEDLAHADRAAAEHFVRAENFIAYGRFEDAAKEYRVAVDLASTRPEPLYGLARTLFAIDGRAPAVQHSDEIRQLLRRCIDLAPHHTAAIALLNEVDALEARYVTSQALARKARVRVASMSAFGIALVIAMVVLVTKTVQDGATPGSNGAGASGAATELASVASSGIPGVAKGVYTLGTSLDLGNTDAQLRIVTHLAELKVYDESAFVEYSGWIVNDSSDLEYWEPSIVFTPVSEDGVPAADASSIQFAVHSGSSVMRPGEQLGFRAIAQVSQPTDRVHFELRTIRSGPAARSYPDGTLIPLSWDIEPPPGISLEVRYRHRRYSENQFSDQGGYMIHDIEIRSTGERALSSLRLAIDYELGGRQIGSENLIVLTPQSGPPINPGTRALMRWQHGLSSGDANTSVRVIEAF